MNINHNDFKKKKKNRVQEEWQVQAREGERERILTVLVRFPVLASKEGDQHHDA
jgi:hypothetical protein